MITGGPSPPPLPEVDTEQNIPTYLEKMVVSDWQSPSRHRLIHHVHGFKRAVKNL